VDSTRITVGFPLYRSRRFLDILVENIEAVSAGGADVELLISDRHLQDDTIDVLEARFRGDPRFRFLRATDGIDWVAHFNLIMREARGAYVVIMGHDDTYSPGYVATLADALDRTPEAVLAYGRVEQLSLDGYLPTMPFTPPPVANTDPWSMRASLRMLTTWQLWFAFRGMVRRDVVTAQSLYIRPTRQNMRADIYWVFALSLYGRLAFVPDCHCLKRFHRSSGGAGWTHGGRQALDACRVLRSYLLDHARSRADRVLAACVLYPWCLVQPLLPRGAAKRLMRALERRRAAARPASRTAAPS